MRIVANRCEGNEQVGVKDSYVAAGQRIRPNRPYKAEVVRPGERRRAETLYRRLPCQGTPVPRRTDLLE